MCKQYILFVSDYIRENKSAQSLHYNVTEQSVGKHLPFLHLLTLCSVTLIARASFLVVTPFARMTASILFPVSIKLIPVHTSG